MIGESTIEAAARRGLAKQRQREKEMKFANEIPTEDTDANNPEATLPAHKSFMEDKLPEHPPISSDRSKEDYQAPSKSEIKVSSNANPGEDSSQGPVQPTSELREKWRRLRKRLHA
jgi:hypothetical protein